MEQASLFILATLYPSDDKYTFTPKTIEGPISLILRDMDGNAHAENSSVTVTSGRKKEYQWRSNMVFSVRNFTTITNQGRGDLYFIEEVRGVMVHELTHSWQWSCSGMPGGLTEGTISNCNTFDSRNCGFCEIEIGIGTGSLE
jgi:Peptidase of plants and bacteria